MTHASPDDVRFMQRALDLAARGAGQVAPNPLVGAVVVRDGNVVGEGWHEHFGGPHAEIMALNAAGAAALGATLYVTLEPCQHHGKTPPCTNAVVEAGIARVVYAMPDPNIVAAGGALVLRQNGVEIDAGVCEGAAVELNAAFAFCARDTSRPFVTVKLAISIDGAIVDKSRARGWLTGDAARRAVHALRARCDAIAVGINTAIADDPALTVREGRPPRVMPQRVIFDRKCRLPVTSTLVRTAREVAVIVVTDGRNPEAESMLRSLGVEVVIASNLGDALQLLRQQGVSHLLVEGGSGLASALMEAGFVDRLITFQAPVILGEGALSAFAALPSRAAETAPRLTVVERRELGPDLMTTYAVSGD